MSQWQRLQERVAGKWQLPLLVLAFALLIGSVYKLRPPPRSAPLPDAINYLNALFSGGAFEDTIELGERLVLREGVTDETLAPVRLLLGRARAELGRRARNGRSSLGEQVVGDFSKAVAGGQPLSADDLVRLGQAYEWQKQFARAVESFEDALAQGCARPFDVRQKALDLRLSHLRPAADEAVTLLNGFLQDLDPARLDLRIWAVDRSLELLCDEGLLQEAATLLTRNHDRFAASDLFPRFRFLEALLLFRDGHFDDAEAQLRALRNQVDRHDSVAAMSGWLLGRVVMSDGGPQRPQEALSFFSDVIALHAGSEYATASRVGAAEALTLLKRHDEAVEAYRTAIEDLDTLGETRLVSRDALRTSLSVLAETQRQAGDLEAAVTYGELSVLLLDPTAIEASVALLSQVAQLLALRGAELDRGTVDLVTESQRPVEARSEAARQAFAASAETYLRVAKLDTLDERRSAEASWWAAELYAKAGERRRAAELYRRFVGERPRHPFVPRALLRIGQLLQMSGRYAEAVAAYQDCYRLFPRTLDGARALIPLAQSYLAMGPEYEEAAEKTLEVVVNESEVFTPQAPEFGEALFLLGEALNRRGEFERAIATLEEVLGRHPDDPRAWRARYFLADSYRRSGLALKAEAKEATFADEMETLRGESLARFDSAQKLYRELIEAFQLRDPTALDRGERVYVRHAHLYEADAYFETQNYGRALKLYEEAAGLYKETPSALAAYVQMINCHVFLGQPDEARAALARAKVLVDSMPESAFARSVSPERRDDWRRYFDWLGRSDLF